MERRSIKNYRESLRRILQGYDQKYEQKRRYRGFLPNNLRNYAISYLDDKRATRYDPRKHYEIVRRLATADNDHALVIRYLARAVANRAGQVLSHASTKLARYNEEGRRRLVGEAMRPVMSLVANDLSRIFEKYGWRAEITFRPYRPPPNLELLHRRLKRKWKRMPPSSIEFRFRTWEEYVREQSHKGQSVQLG